MPTVAWPPVAGYGFNWDDGNRLIGFTNSQHSGENVAYAYDNAGQLTGANYTSQTDETYSYDDNGNRTGGGYDTGDNNQLDSDGTFHYTYDGEGNTLTKTRLSNDPADDHQTEYAWDHRNRLTEVVFKDNGGDVTKRVEYSYDAFDRWIRKTVDAGDDGIDRTLANVYDGDQIVLQFADDDAADLAAGDLTHRDLWGPAVDELLADEAVSALGSAGTVSWPLGDHVGTVRDIVQDASGSATVVDHNSYDSFGNKLSQSSAASDIAFGFTGRAFDADTGL
ncbi:MAG: hypothetical protein IT427_15860, partial [Pirellulales bacterium]|nr:hypothetical protein [Pirellulales bacterium]